MNDAMPLCNNCYRQPSQMADICYAAKQESLTPEAFVFKYWNELGLSPQNRFLCADCREKFLSGGPLARDEESREM